MKSNSLICLLASLLLSGCDQGKRPAKVEFPVIEKTAKDLTQSEAIRKSAGIFLNVLTERKGITRASLSHAHGQMVRSRSATTIASYVEFLKALEKKLPKDFPSLETYEAMSDTAGTKEIIEYNVAETVIMMSNSIKNISIYGDPGADLEVDEVLKRVKKSYGNSETGKKIVEVLNIVREQGLKAHSWGIKPWESPDSGSSF